MKPEDQYRPKHSEEELTRIALDVIEASREALPKGNMDIGLMCIVVDGVNMRENRQFRTRMITNVPEQLKQAVLETVIDGMDSNQQIMRPKMDYVLRAEPAHFGSVLGEVNLKRGP